MWLVTCPPYCTLNFSVSDLQNLCTSDHSPSSHLPRSRSPAWSLLHSYLPFSSLSNQLESTLAKTHLYTVQQDYHTTESSTSWSTDSKKWTETHFLQQRHSYSNKATPLSMLLSGLLGSFLFKTQQHPKGFQTKFIINYLLSSETYIFYYQWLYF